MSLSAALPGRFLLGVNYWSRGGGPRMWERFDRELIGRELAAMRRIGLDCCRAFAFIPSFMPRPPEVEEEMLGRFSTFLELAEREQIGVFPTALVGHMSGENFHFPGREAGEGHRSLYADPELRRLQAALVSQLTKAGRPSDAVLGWVLSNEMPLWAKQEPPEVIADWFDLLRDAISACDRRPSRPVGTGDGMMAAFPTRRLASRLDWIGPHIYYGDTDPLRHALRTDFAIQVARRFGKPVLLEEFGCSTTQAGETEQAAYFRESIVAAIGVGAAGALGWCFSDLDPAVEGQEPPYVHHGFELGFGLVRHDGSEKPVCDELRALRGLLDRLGQRPNRPRSRTALVWPSYLEEPYPFSWEDRGLLERTLLSSYVSACQAGLDPDVVDEEGPLDQFELLLCPATQKLRTPTWLQLEEAARRGATVYWSYFYGDYNFHQGAWCPNFESLTGLRHRLRYGLADLPPSSFELEGAVTLKLPTGLPEPTPYPLSRLPAEVRPDAAVRPLAFADGRPALFEHALGRGRVVFCTHPVERYVARLTLGSKSGAHRFYQQLFGPYRTPYASSHPEVIARSLEIAGKRLVIVQNRGWEATSDEVDPLRGETPIYARDADGRLGAKAVRVYLMG